MLSVIVILGVLAASVAVLAAAARWRLQSWQGCVIEVRDVCEHDFGWPAPGQVCVCVKTEDERVRRLALTPTALPGLETGDRLIKDAGAMLPRRAA